MSHSEYSDDMSEGSAGGISDAECVDEYSVDSDGNIKPDQLVRSLPRVLSSNSDVKKDDKFKNMSPEEKRKQKLLEKLDKRIKGVTKKHDKEKKIKIEPKLIKNKQKRQEVALMRKQENRRTAKIEKLKV